MLSKIAALALLSATALAVPAPAASSGAPYSWSVTDYASTCTAATCFYGFNVSGPTGPSGEPSFTATGCSGRYPDQQDFKSCAEVGIDLPGDVRILEQGVQEAGKAIVFVQLSWKKDNTKYTLTGNQTVAHTGLGGPIGFEIVPNAITGVPDKK